MTSNKTPRSFGTHDGSFHADEVTACALLLNFDLIDQDKIVRTRNMQQLAKCEYVCDVGGVYDAEEKLFDHHQLDYQGGMSSAGMILLYLKESGIIHEREYQYFCEALINGVDEHDNGRDPLIPGLCTYSHIIALFVPFLPDTNAEKQDKAFFQALEFARGHLKRMHERFQYMQQCRNTVEKAMQEGRECLFFDHYTPWLELFFELGGEDHPALFIIMPSGEHWKLRGVPPSLRQKMKVRVPLPEEWAGLLEDDLKKVSGIPGAIFCHKGRFISVWKTKDDAIKALEYVLSKSKGGV